MRLVYVWNILKNIAEYLAVHYAIVNRVFKKTIGKIENDITVSSLKL